MSWIWQTPALNYNLLEYLMKSLNSTATLVFFFFFQRNNLTLKLCLGQNWLIFTLKMGQTVEQDRIKLYLSHKSFNFCPFIQLEIQFCIFLRGCATEQILMMSFPVFCFFQACACECVWVRVAPWHAHKCDLGCADWGLVGRAGTAGLRLAAFVSRKNWCSSFRKRGEALVSPSLLPSPSPSGFPPSPPFFPCVLALARLPSSAGSGMLRSASLVWTTAAAGCLSSRRAVWTER